MELLGWLNAASFLVISPLPPKTKMTILLLPKTIVTILALLLLPRPKMELVLFLGWYF